MKRKSNTNAQVSAAMLSAGVLLAPGVSATAQGALKAAPSSAKTGSERSAGSTHIKFASNFLKWGADLRVAGLLNGRPVFKTRQGEFFQVEPASGDLRFLSSESLGYIKVSDLRVERSAAPKAGIFIKFDGIKGEQRVLVAGVDAQGNVIQENSRGERFYLGPNGDMVFVK